ncbi:hypothetical protein Cob_v012744 [Colletotrichum orbiculare MAFF 240422]|uniref:Uncharacterized protein n=1 Tax=Colletotrichum orbiculare (strain 104-T / ATCC 96160 / CBS 514.97 / LARS 414 / MAFF 240422) TaxID=1213857 RepID=A0A484F7V6_COLOR|nr:hypothetical protein Cob_v012744 [Colletotrichum orbiculare MAFF 240422]
MCPRACTRVRLVAPISDSVILHQQTHENPNPSLLSKRRMLREDKRKNFKRNPRTEASKDETDGAAWCSTQ